MPWCSREDQQQHRAIRIPGQKDPGSSRGWNRMRTGSSLWEGISGQFFDDSSALACCQFKRETKQFPSLAMFGYKQLLTPLDICPSPG